MRWPCRTAQVRSVFLLVDDTDDKPVDELVNGNIEDRQTKDGEYSQPKCHQHRNEGNRLKGGGGRGGGIKLFN